ncbi:MAG TPA: hypothetical protein PKO33_07795 [Pyrinomonadaceae bacterium]|nr:hypothetical protein [Pyrinomonadaceae bacterium]
MSQDFRAGDFLIFQVESGFGLLRILAIDERESDRVWHLRGYAELFPDIESADAALDSPELLTVSLPHTALTTRAFEATPTSRMMFSELGSGEVDAIAEWRKNGEVVTDRSIRLMLGLR